MSIRKRLTLILLSMMVLTCFLALVKGYQKSMSHGEQLLDSELKVVAGVLMQQPLSINAMAQKMQEIVSHMRAPKRSIKRPLTSCIGA